MAVKDNETFYDTEIYPRMEEVLRLCKEADLPFFAQFHLSTDDGGPLYCSMGWMGSNANTSAQVRTLIQNYGPMAAPSLRMTIITKP